MSNSANPHDTQMADLLEQYLNELELDPLAQPPRGLDPEMIETVQKMNAHLDASGPRPKFVASLRNRLDREAAHLGRSRKAPPRGFLTLPRWSFVAIGAALVIAFVAFALWATRPAPVSAQALLSRARSAASDLSNVGVKSFEMQQESYDVLVDDPNAPPTRETRGEMKTWYAGPTRWHIETQSETTHQPLYKTIQIADGGAQYDYDVTNKTVNIQVAEPSSFPSPSVLSLDFLQQDMSNCYSPRIVGEEVIAGRAAYKVDMGIAKCRSASAPELNGPHTLWLDKETFFVLKSEIRALNSDRVTSSFRVTSIRYNIDLSDDLFTFLPPADAKVNDMRPKPAPSQTEYQAQLSALAQRIGFPIFAPAQSPSGFAPRAPQFNEIENQIELAYVPADAMATGAMPDQDSISIIEKRADYDLVRNWTDGAEQIEINGNPAWVRRGDFDTASGLGSNSAVLVLRDGVLISISSFRVPLEQLLHTAQSLETVPGSHAPLANPTAPILQELRAQADYPILIPTYLPDGLTPAPPTQNQIEYLRADGTKALIVQFSKQGTGGMEQEDRFRGKTVMLANGRTAHQLAFEPQITILWWNQDGAYLALEGHGIARDEMLKIAASMSATAELGETQAPSAAPTPTPVPAPSFTVLRPTWLPEAMTITERNVPAPTGQGAGIEIRFDAHPNDIPHDALTLTEFPQAGVQTITDEPEMTQENINGRDVNIIRRGKDCVTFYWIQDQVFLELRNPYDLPDAPGQVRYTCDQMKRIVASIK